MAKTTVEELQEALGEVLKIYNIKLDDPSGDGPKSSDFSEMINKTQSQIDDLSERAEAIYKRTGMTREQLEAYAANPNNFTKEQWDALQKVRVACERYKQEAKARIVTLDPGFDAKVEKQKRQKQLHRFAKKKHWSQV